MNESMQSAEDYQIKTNINAYDDVPIKSFSRESNPLASNTISLTTNNKFEPNFHSDAYKSQAKESFKRRMHYNPREAASKSRER